MTVVASTADVPSQGYLTGLGKGGTLLAGIAATQALVTAKSTPALVAQLNLLQIEAVDYFMGSYWVSADQILATMTSMMILPKAGDAYVTAQIAKIAIRTGQVAALIAANYTQVGTPPGGLSGSNPQYSRGYPQTNSGYPLTLPDIYLYGLQTALIDYCMAKAILPASLVLSTMTGAQTYPWNGYASNYTTYSDDYA